MTMMIQILVFRYVASLFCKTATAFNPFIYFFMSKGFRQDFILVMHKLCFGDEDLSIFVQAAGYQSKGNYSSSTNYKSSSRDGSKTWSERRRESMIKERRLETQQDP